MKDGAGGTREFAVATEGVLAPSTSTEAPTHLRDSYAPGTETLHGCSDAADHDQPCRPEDVFVMMHNLPADSFSFGNDVTIDAVPVNQTSTNEA